MFLSLNKIKLLHDLFLSKTLFVTRFVRNHLTILGPISFVLRSFVVSTVLAWLSVQYSTTPLNPVGFVPCQRSLLPIKRGLLPVCHVDYCLFSFAYSPTCTARNPTPGQNFSFCDDFICAGIPLTSFEDSFDRSCI